MRTSVALIVVGLVAVGLACVACESGTSLRLDIEFGDAASQGFSAEAPGVVRVKTESVAAFTVAALCQENFSADLDFTKDFGFGCLDDALEGVEEVVTGWVEPLPDGFDAAELCRLGSRAGEEIVVPPRADVDPPPELPAEPDDDDIQGTGTMVWTRDFSPCGGQGRGDVVITPL